MSNTRRVLSGVQPSGKLHLGNYFGAIKQHIELQDDPKNEPYYFVADYHALTTVRDAATLRALVRDVALDYLALGLNPSRSVFYVQSDVPEVTELTWMLSTVTGMGLLERAHSYKDKTSRGISAEVGLFTYPILMAADILAPQSDIVPVGADQKQHIEMTRDMAGYFNRTYKAEVFKLPDYQESPVPRVSGTNFDKSSHLHISVAIEGRDKKGARARMQEAVAALNHAVAACDLAHPRLQISFLEAMAAAVGHVPGVRLSLTNQTPGGTFQKDASGRQVAAVGSIALPLPVFGEDDGKRRHAKMSKSYHNTIDIFAEGKALKKQIMAIETDLKGVNDPLDPDDDLVFALYALFASADELHQMRSDYARPGFGYGHAKLKLLAKVDATFEGARERRRQLETRPDEIEDVLLQGAKTARAVCRATVEAAREAVGMGPRLRAP